MIVFRADAGYRIGYGHFIRSLALAEMLKDNFECEFYTSEPTPYQEDLANGICKLNPLPTDDRKFEIFINKLRGEEIVVLDNYFYDETYQREIASKGCRVVCIDDRPGISYYADAIINHVIGLTEDDIRNSKEGKIFIGPQYSLLRKEFRMGQEKSRQFVSDSIMIALGGVDYNNNAYMLCNKLQKLGFYRINVVVGDGYRDMDSLKELDINVHRNLSAKDLSALIRSQQVVICTPSTIAYETAALGVPMIVGSYADNHYAVERRISQSGIGLGCGSLSELTEERLEDLISRVTSDKEMFLKQCKYFDGNQKKRFLSIFEDLHHSS